MNYRLYADGRVVFEDDFALEDDSQPYYDDYEECYIPELIYEYIVDSLK